MFVSLSDSDFADSARSVSVRPVESAIPIPDEGMGNQAGSLRAESVRPMMKNIKGHETLQPGHSDSATRLDATEPACRSGVRLPVHMGRQTESQIAASILAPPNLARPDNQSRLPAIAKRHSRPAAQTD